MERSRDDRRYRQRWGGKHFLGIDVGFSRDYTAFALFRAVTPNVLVPVTRAGDDVVPWDVDADAPLVLPEGVSLEKFIQPKYHVIDLQRILGSSFEIVAREARKMVEEINRCTIAVDATGMGRGLIEEMQRIGLSPIAVTLGGGNRITGGRLNWRVPSAMVYETTYTVFAQSRYKIASQLEHTRTLFSELQRCEVRRTDTGHARYGVWTGEDGHGDLVMALGLGTVVAENLTTPRVMQSAEFTVGGTPGREGRPGTPVRKGGGEARGGTGRRYIDQLMDDIREQYRRA